MPFSTSSKGNISGTETTTSGAMCPVSGSPVQERHWHAGVSLAEGHQEGGGSGAHGVWGEVRGLISLSLRKRW